MSHHGDYYERRKGMKVRSKSHIIESVPGGQEWQL